MKRDTKLFIRIMASAAIFASGIFVGTRYDPNIVMPSGYGINEVHAAEAPISVCDLLVDNIKFGFKLQNYHRRNSTSLIVLDAAINTYRSIGGNVQCGKNVKDILEEINHGT